MLYEKTAMTEQYCEQLQKFTAINVGLNLYPVSSQEEVAKFLIQMVCCCQLQSGLICVICSYHSLSLCIAWGKRASIKGKTSLSFSGEQFRTANGTIQQNLFNYSLCNSCVKEMCWVLPN